MNDTTALSLKGTVAVRHQNDHQIVQIMEELDTATARGRQYHSQLPIGHQIVQVMEGSRNIFQMCVLIS